VIPIPPLRERKEDIELLAQHFLQKHGSNGEVLSSEALRKLTQYDWPGNVRELEACIVRAVIRSNGGSIGDEDIVHDGVETGMRDIQRVMLEEVLCNAGGSVKGAAGLLGVHRNTVYNRARKLGLRIDQFRGLNDNKGNLP
jgi:transcriptional regulator with GAF, ATPase, and Fis domain